MAYDEGMAELIRDHLTGTPGLVEKKMFGGIGWTVHGHMATGAHSDGRLMIRCSKEDWDGIMALPGAVGMIRGGKAMKGWILVEPDGLVDDDALHTWIDRGRSYAASLPPK